mmetsp:Transcript_28313/g.92434  ORF Transcript_28313/g.92434 Transcript_28313/m.92434 type:complete len:605 (-) Transcript_28313:150-1964(-)|eukprot:CAMPEP_0170141100 /NCGR_PEP_ID=MMETSP0033_2-20121228/6777_1 /TAXON_ID=195969 /ORGANISM="Dolichomastix tenuilepis, Strain CCMP3274" /LENGTH=604 /DNA_ID=CAMNT_0010377347 /DNA_START=180 /DNA_END=1994 /DNA_ORIENTATION=-
MVSPTEQGVEEPGPAPPALVALGSEAEVRDLPAETPRESAGEEEPPLLRCLDPTHPRSCRACHPPPDVGDVDSFVLVGDPGLKNGEKKLRSLLQNTAEWRSLEHRSLLVDQLEQSGGDDDRVLAGILRQKGVPALRKQHFLTLARAWGYRSDIWRPRVARTSAGAGGARAAGGGAAAAAAAPKAAPGKKQKTNSSSSDDSRLSSLTTTNHDSSAGAVDALGKRVRRRSMKAMESSMDGANADDIIEAAEMDAPPPRKRVANERQRAGAGPRNEAGRGVEIGSVGGRPTMVSMALPGGQPPLALQRVGGGSAAATAPMGVAAAYVNNRLPHPAGIMTHSGIATQHFEGVLSRILQPQLPRMIEPMYAPDSAAFINSQRTGMTQLWKAAMQNIEAMDNTMNLAIRSVLLCQTTFLPLNHASVPLSRVQAIVGTVEAQVAEYVRLLEYAQRELCTACPAPVDNLCHNSCQRAIELMNHAGNAAKSVNLSGTFVEYLDAAVRALNFGKSICHLYFAAMHNEGWVDKANGPSTLPGFTAAMPVVTLKGSAAASRSAVVASATNSDKSVETFDDLMFNELLDIEFAANNGAMNGGPGPANAAATTGPNLE